jgi:NDP-sugar pyrophosphorylase family protein/putative flippase GtrA
MTRTPREQLPTVCILAGGLGTRLGERVREQPKPLLEVAGQPFLWHQLRLLAGCGAHEIVLCVGYLGEQVRERVGVELFGLSISYSFDAVGLSGTLGAIRRAADMLGERFLVLYGDTYLRINYAAAANAWRTSGLPAMMSVLRNEGRWGTSNATYAEGRVLAYDKSAPLAQMRWIDYGLGGLERSALERAPAQMTDLAELYRLLAARRLLCGYEAHTRFFEIGTPETLAETDAFLRAQVSHTAPVVHHITPVVHGAAPAARRTASAAHHTASAVHHIAPAGNTARVRRPEVVDQGKRFVLAGATVALVYLLATTLLSSAAHLRFQLALLIGFCTGLVVHFTLQRTFVWVGQGEFALPVRWQAARYLTMAGVQYGLTAAATSLLPALLGVPVEGVYLATAFVLTAINFVVFRHVIFHPRERSVGASPLRGDGGEAHPVDPP